MVWVYGLLHSAKPVFLHPPYGYRVKPGHVLQLRKSLYGLRTSPKSWYDTLSKKLITKGGLQQSKVDPALFFKMEGKRLITLAICWVDDLLVCSTSDRDRRKAQGNDEH